MIQARDAFIKAMGWPKGYTTEPCTLDQEGSQWVCTWDGETVLPFVVDPNNGQRSIYRRTRILGRKTRDQKGGCYLRIYTTDPIGRKMLNKMVLKLGDPYWLLVEAAEAYAESQGAEYGSKEMESIKKKVIRAMMEFRKK